MTYPLAAFLTITFSSAFAPGPSCIMSMAIGQKYGFKKSLLFIFGATLGHLTLLFILAYLNNLLFTFIPSIQNIMRVIGTLYLTYLAWTVFKSPSIDTESSQEDPTINKKMFISAYFLQFINPKAILFTITIFSTYGFPYFDDFFPILLMICVMNFSMFSALLTWSAFGSLLHHHILKHQKAFNTVMALLLLYCAFSVSGISSIIQNLLAS